MITQQKRFPQYENIVVLWADPKDLHELSRDDRRDPGPAAARPDAPHGRTGRLDLQRLRILRLRGAGRR
ncbi:hypothetical protein GCM10009696_17020 [Kocuria himachalensis]